MALEFHDVEFDNIGRKAAQRDLTWSVLTLAFRDTETNHHPSAALTLLLPIRPEMTVAELEAEARTRGKTLLEAALAALQEKDVGALRREVDDRAKAEQNARDAAWEEFKSEKHSP
jgi:hypothetical protein